jgi:Uncharacterised nucleotidyltransferase
MSEKRPRRGHRAVSRQQELLLRAALLEGAASRAAWEQWRREVALEDLDEDSQRLLPLLYRALRLQNISVPEMGRLKGIYRRTWADNMRRFHDGAAVLRALQDAGIATMLLKGAALAARYYGDPSLRPMWDFDILVPADRGAAAIDLLKRLGWTPLQELVGVTEAEALAAAHAYPFQGPQDQQIDLHWHVFYQHVDPAADADLWAAAKPIVLSGVPTHTLSAADQLLHVCVHGIERAWWGGEVLPNSRWVADAMMILRTAEADLDWDRLAVQAQRLHFVLPMREALSYLRDLLGLRLPDGAMRIYRLPAPVAERIAERARMGPSRHWGPWIALGVRYLEYSSTFPPGTGVVRQLTGLPAFFQRRWRSRSLWHLPFEAAFRVWRRIRWTQEQRTRRGVVSTVTHRP